MIVQSLKQPMALAWPAFAALGACAAIVACSKAPATPDAYVSALVGGGAACSTFGNGSQQFLQIGTTTNPNQPETVPAGTGVVSVECTVAPSGSGYRLQLAASGPATGKMTITGNVDSKGGTVSATFANDHYGAFVANACTLTYEFNRTPVPTNLAISAGEIFGHIDCKNAVQNGGLMTGDTSVMCDASADFLFANCADGS